ncbi:uncharacterized protein LOC129939653 [Eupeodes corollae]|uniref:uncharacterized protein LOC129939653 n=1 Tax=Eupeodes corollae TaxID=290404 RepID=UPI0024932AEB|nr:uncharacterized protein LOC129939653 [Eupeodes corollae]
MSKTTNKCQLQILLSLMEAQRDIACGFQKGSKEEVLLFWHAAENALNASGPPSKNISEWKKVWCDQKKYVRAKAATNLKARNGTGGGPNKEQKLSDYEQAVYDLIGMKESIEGVTAKTFGLETKKVNKENVQPPENEPVVEGYLQELVIEALYDEPESTPVNTTQRGYPRPSTSSTKKRTASEAFDEELKTQRELCEAVKGVVEEIKENRRNTTKVYRALDKIYEFKKKSYEDYLAIKKEKLEELTNQESKNFLLHLNIPAQSAPLVGSHSK